MGFKGASDKAQSRLLRPLLKQFGDFEDEILTDQEYIELLRQLVRKAESRLVNMTPGSPERKELGYQKNLISEEIARVKPNQKGKVKSFFQCFMEVVKEDVSPEKFKEYSIAAQKKHQRPKRLIRR